MFNTSLAVHKNDLRGQRLDGVQDGADHGDGDAVPRRDGNRFVEEPREVGRGDVGNGDERRDQVFNVFWKERAQN